MKKITAVLLSLILTFNITGCSSQATSTENMTPTQIVQTYGENSKEVNALNEKNSSLEKNKVLENVEKSLKDITSTDSDYTVLTENLDENGKTNGEGSKHDIKAKIIYDEKGEISKVYNSLQFDGEDTITSSYVDLESKKAYYDDGTGMKPYDVTEDSDLQVNNESEYKNTVKMMLLASEHMNMSEDDDNYYLTFAGKNGDLLYAIDGLFGLGINLLELEDVEIDINYTIRKADFAITDIVHKAKQEYQGDNYSSVGTFHLNAINTLEEIEEVKDLK